MDNITSSAQNNKNCSPKVSLLKKVLNSAAFIPLVFFITSISLWGAFISKVYYEKKSETIIAALDYRGPEKAPPSKNIHDVTLIEVESSEALMIEELTKQLAEQQQQNTLLEKQLETQQTQLNLLIKDSLRTASSADIEYLNALNGKRNTKKISEQNTRNSVTNIDYYNRVSSKPSNEHTTKLQLQFDQLMNNKSGSNHSIYEKEIDKESDTRKNEVRSIVLKRGESIWMIAKRAYGNGFQYHKIMTANPQITEKNARFLKPGTRIRVPI